jgi:hypothetical protein
MEGPSESFNLDTNGGWNFGAAEMVDSSSDDEEVDMDTSSSEVGLPGPGENSQHHRSNMPTPASGVNSLCNGYGVEPMVPTPASGVQDNATPIGHPLYSAVVSEFALDNPCTYLPPTLNQLSPTLPNPLFYHAQQGYVVPLVENRFFDTAGVQAKWLLHQAETLGHHPFTLLQYNPMALPQIPWPVTVGGNVVWITRMNENETPSPEGNAEIKTSRKAGLPITVDVGPDLFPTQETMKRVVKGYKEIGVEVVSVVFLGPRVVITLAAMPKIVLPTQVGRCQAVYFLQDQPLVGSGFEKLRAFQRKFPTKLFHMPGGVGVGDEVSVMDRVQGKLQGVLVGVEWARWIEGGDEKWLMTGWCYFGNDMEGLKEAILGAGRGYVVVNKANIPVGVFGYMF